MFQPAGFGAGFSGFFALLEGDLALAVDVADQLVGAQVVGVDLTLGGIDDLLRQSQALGDGQGIRTSGQPDGQFDRLGAGSGR